jgi:hypothetical protein
MGTIGNFIWGSPVKRLTTICTAIAAVAGVVVAVPPAWSALGLPEIASKVFVHTQVDPLKTAQADTTKAVYQLQLSNLQSSLYAAKLDQQKAPSQTVDERIQDLTQQIQDTQAKLNAGH